MGYPNNFEPLIPMRNLIFLSHSFLIESDIRTFSTFQDQSSAVLSMCIGCNKIATLRLREAQPHWCEASHHCEAHHLRLAATSFICATSWGMMFSLRSKWCWPTVKWCCAFGTNEKVQVKRLGLFGSPNWVNKYKTINNRFYEVKSIKQGVTEQICDLSALRLCDLTGA